VVDVPNGIADVSRTGVIAIPITSDACAFTNVVDANRGLLRMAQEADGGGLNAVVLALGHMSQSHREL
jgi:hypothetical protein